MIALNSSDLFSSSYAIAHNSSDLFLSSYALAHNSSDLFLSSYALAHNSSDLFLSSYALAHDSTYIKSIFPSSCAQRATRLKSAQLEADNSKITSLNLFTWNNKE